MESKIEALLNEKFAEEGFADCFLVDMELSKNNKLEVFIDSDSGMTFAKCQQISRFLEQFIDEGQWLGEQYTLEVSSPGVSRPLKFLRQYQKNINRSITVMRKDGSSQEGKLNAVTDEAITIEAKVVIKEGNKKRAEVASIIIPFAEIKETKVNITF
jgi:ribosome maturation factor RimP